MQYQVFLLILIFLLSVSVAWIVLGDVGDRFFTKQTFKYCLTLFLLFAFLGAGNLLVKKPIMLPASAYFWAIHIVFFIFGLLFIRTLNNRFSWAWKEKNPFSEAFPIALFLWVFCAIAFFIFSWMLEKPFFKNSEGWAENYTLGIILSAIPFTVLSVHHFWNQIPIIIKELNPWIPDLQQSPLVIEQDPKGIVLTVKVQSNYGSENIITFDIRAPRQYTLAEIFLNLLYEHNEIKKSIVQVEVAERNKSSKVYGWVFFKVKKRWWGLKKEYLDPLEKLGSNQQIMSKDVVFADRVKTWG